MKVDQRLPRSSEDLQLQQAVLQVLLYFDIFAHPLTAAEVHFYLPGCQALPDEVQQALDSLCQAAVICCQEAYYFLPAPSSPVQRRRQGQQLADRYLKIARWTGRFIGCFPFVRTVAVSGSLSKGYADRHSDIDFFVIAAPGRLWLCKTLLMLFKKFFLFNSRKYFCVNYFIAADQLGIPDKNIFTATEVVSLLPVYGEHYLPFMLANQWVKSLLPNARPHAAEEKKQSFFPFFPLKKLAEKLLSGKWGEALEKKCFDSYQRYHRKKFAHLDEAEYELQFRAGREVSKHHPGGYQSKVMDSYRKKLAEYHLAVPGTEQVVQQVNS